MISLITLPDHLPPTPEASLKDYMMEKKSDTCSGPPTSAKPPIIAFLIGCLCVWLTCGSIWRWACWGQSASLKGLLVLLYVKGTLTHGEAFSDNFTIQTQQTILRHHSYQSYRNAWRTQSEETSHPHQSLPYPLQIRTQFLLHSRKDVLEGAAGPRQDTSQVRKGTNWTVRYCHHRALPESP